MLIGEPRSRSHRQGNRGYLCPCWRLPLLLSLSSTLPSTHCAGRALQAAVHSIVQGNWFPGWALVLTPGAAAARYRPWRVDLLAELSWAGAPAGPSLPLPEVPDLPQ